FEHLHQLPHHSVAKLGTTYFDHARSHRALEQFDRFGGVSKLPDVFSGTGISWIAHDPGFAHSTFFPCEVAVFGFVEGHAPYFTVECNDTGLLCHNVMVLKLNIPKGGDEKTSVETNVRSVRILQMSA